MKKHLSISLILMSTNVLALPAPVQSCKVVDLQARYARLYAAGNTCGVDEKSHYARNVNILFQKDQADCKVDGRSIDPTEKQIDEAINEINQNLSATGKKEMCDTLDNQIDQTLINR